MTDGKRLMAMFKEIRLPKVNEDATLCILGPQDLADVLQLQIETRDALPDAQKMFVLPQTPSYFEALLAQKNGLMIGIRNQAGELISQMVLMGPLTLDEAVEQQKITRNDITYHHADAADSVVIAKSMAVHPSWRGNELSQNMLEAAINLPLSRSADHIFAQISVDNIRSWELFLRNGFGVIAAAIDPNDQKARFIVQRPALGFALHHRQSAFDVDPGADFAAIMRLTGREALIGRLDKGEAFKLAFYPSTEMAASWSETPRKAKKNI